MRTRSVLFALVATSFTFCSVSGVAEARSSNGVPYNVQVLRTSYGIPHIQATDWGSLGYGYGYAFAQDNACVLAADVLVSTGTRSRYFGPGANSANVVSDWVYAMVNSDSRVNPAWDSLDGDTRALMQGYADGYNRYLRDTNGQSLAADCKGATWVRPLTGLDVYKVLRKLLVRAGIGQFTSALVGAAPPQPGARVEPASSQALGIDEAARLLAAAELPDYAPERFGSNALGLGSDLTGGAGALLGNPHFPWLGIERFYAVHLTIPGRYDVMGASIFGFPLVNIGFNRHLAWSHTVSTARRFVVRELTLAAGNPTSYVLDGQATQMQPEVVAVDVLVAPGVVQKLSHTFYQTKFGTVLIIPPLANWTAQKAYALTDVNLDNTRSFQLYREMGTAQSLPEFDQALRRHVALPWVNTIAADAAGNAYYGDISVVPHVTNARLAACANTIVAQTLSALRVYTLDGSTSACSPGSDADAPAAGIFGGSSLPGILRRDFAHNANDSYWLANPAAKLEGYPSIIGTDENRPQSFRTRLGLTQVNDRLAGTDGLPGTGFNRQWLQDVLFANRHYSGEIMRAGLLTLCATENPIVNVGGVPVNVTEACNVLAAWDGRNKVASVGAHVWGEFWRRATAPAIANLYAVPFNPADPVNTPRGVNLADAAVRARLMSDLGATAKYFADNGIPLNRPWGQVQFDVRNGVPIPIHGGSGVSGVYNAMAPAALVPGVGYPQILAGSSYIQAVTFRPSGPDARAIVTYSQSTDPANPHYADMTQLFSQSGWVTMPFAEGDIRRDPNLVRLHLKE